MRALLTVALTGVLASFGLADEKKSVVREVKLKEVEMILRDRGEVAKPTKIVSAEELAKTLGKTGSESLAKEVDFSKEYLLLFRWAGSGGDKLTANGEKKAIFSHERGLTRDLRPHLHLFAVAKDAEWELSK